MSAAAICSIVTGHHPVPLTVERHHVVPVSWQFFWAPRVAPYPGPDPDGRGFLWDDRTVEVCPTHHRNIHFLIVGLMHAVRVSGEDVVSSLPYVETRAHRGEYQIAQQALARWKQAGGSLLALVAAGEYGEA